MSVLDPSDLIHRITIADQTGATSNGYPDPSFGAQRVVDARIENRPRRFWDTDGNEINTDTWIVTLEPITPQTRIWLPGANVLNADESRLARRVHSATELDGSEVIYEAFL